MTDKSGRNLEHDRVTDQGDAPIDSLAEDRLGRDVFAEALAAEVLAAPADRGFVMGLTGPWGSGKTSILNMTVDAIGEKAIVVQFNPWMFSGTEALVSSFFEEIGKQLQKRDSKFRAVAQKLSTYGRLLSPLASVVGAGGAVGTAADLVGQLATKPSLFDQRLELRTLLKKLGKRLVVIIDDVDRLRPQEVLDIVRLVRPVGDFPNTLYLLAFDRFRVEECLGEGNSARGRAYLEKIVQVTHDVPAARERGVTALFLEGLQDLVDNAVTGPLKGDDWQNIFAFIVRPLLITPRQARRLLSSLSMTIRLVGEEVALADLVGMEALRVLQPEMFEAIVAVADHISATTVRPADRFGQPGQNAASSPIAQMIEVDAQLATEICAWLFPAARAYFENKHYGEEWESIWRQQRKVASRPVLRFYLERQLPPGVVPAGAVVEAIARLRDGPKLQELFDACPTTRELVDLVQRMDFSLDEIPFKADAIDQDPARVGLPVLLELLDRLPEETSPLGFSGFFRTMRTAARLLGRIDDQDLRTEVVKAVLQDTRSVTGRLALVLAVGHREGVGERLIDASTAEELEVDLRNALIGMQAFEFGRESQPVRLAQFMVETDEGRAASAVLSEDDQVMLSLFVGAVSEVRSHTMGSVAVEVTKVLSWDHLADWLGESTLVRRTAELMAEAQHGAMTVAPEERAALDLAATYAAGNGPTTPFGRTFRGQAAAQTSAESEPSSTPPPQEDRDPMRDDVAVGDPSTDVPNAEPSGGVQLG